MVKRPTHFQRGRVRRHNFKLVRQKLRGVIRPNINLGIMSWFCWELNLTNKTEVPSFSHLTKRKNFKVNTFFGIIRST